MSPHNDRTSRNQRLPERIYLRRRVAAAAILVVVVALFIWLVSLFVGGDDEQQPTAAETSTAQEPVATTVAPAAPTTSEAPTSEAPTTTSPAPTASAAASTCTLADLEITAQTSAPDFAAGAQPVFYMTVRNPTAADCVIDVDAEPLRFEVYDLRTNARVWSDIDCNDPVESGETTFAAGEERNFEAVWSRTESAPNECSNRQEVPAGGYFLHAVIGDNPSDAVPFNLA